MVHILSKPKAPIRSAYSSRTTMTTVKGLGSIRRTITRLVDKTLNQGQITITPHKNQRRSSTKRKWKHHCMSDKTFNQMISSTSLLHTRPPRPSFLHHQGLASYITRVLFPTPSKFPLSPQRLIHTTTSNRTLHRQRQHT